MNYRSFFLYATSALGLSLATPSDAVDREEATSEPPVTYIAQTGTPHPAKADAFPATLMVPAADMTTAASAPQEPSTSYSWDDKSETVLKFDGRSWTITRKDIRTGAIERFTQSGTGALGRLEVMQGKGVNLPKGTPLPASMDALHRQLFTWNGVEDSAAPGLGSRQDVPLPRTMRRDVAGIILSSPDAAGPALNNLLPDNVRKEMAAETRALVDGLNSEAASHRKSAPRTATPSQSVPT